MRKLRLPIFLTLIIAIASTVIIFLSGCGKEGAAGKDGKDASETCKQCHTSTVVDRVATEFELSKHSTGEAASEEAGNTSCAPCHEQEGFKYVCTNNTPVAFVLNAGKWTNPYAATSSTSYGEFLANVPCSSFSAGQWRAPRQFGQFINVLSTRALQSGQV